MVMTKEDVKHHTTCHINMLHHVYMKTRDNKLEKLNQMIIISHYSNQMGNFNIGNKKS